MRRHAAQRARALIASVLRGRGVRDVLGGSVGAQSLGSFLGATNLPRPPVARCSSLIDTRSASTSTTRSNPETKQSTEPPVTPSPTVSRLRQMRVAELRAACVARGLDDFGKKDELVHRLKYSGGDGSAFLPTVTTTLEESDETTTSWLYTYTSGTRNRERPERILLPHEHGIDSNLIPPYVKTLEKRLQGDGGVSERGGLSTPRLFIVGGAVRDLYLGKTPRDFDLLTDASWGQIKRRVRPVVVVGRRFKVAHCFEEKGHGGRRTGVFFELVSMRERKDDTCDEDDDVDDHDGTTPDPGSSQDGFVDRLRSDAFRRDFSMNALAYDVQSGILYDFVGALEDIDSKTVRTVHPGGPIDSFVEDPARMLRAVRLAARHDFALSGNVLSAIKASAHLLRKEHTARLAGELKALLTRGFSEKAVILLWETGILEHVLHLHATHVARGIDPETTYVAAPPGAFAFGDDEVVVSRKKGRAKNKSSLVTNTSDTGDDHSEITLPDAPWVNEGYTNTGSSLTRHGRGGKRVSKAQLDCVVKADPLFRILRALDRRVQSDGSNSTSVSENLAMTCLTSAFAVAKVGWPPLEPAGMGGQLVSEQTSMEKRSTKTKKTKKKSKKSGTDDSGLPKFAHPSLRAKIDQYHALDTDVDRLNWKTLAEKSRVNKPKVPKRKVLSKGKKKENDEMSDTHSSTPIDPTTTWHNAFSQWTETCGYAARVMQHDYHISAKNIMTQALVTCHVPSLWSEPVQDVLERRASLTARKGIRKQSGNVPDLSGTLKPAVLRVKDLGFTGDNGSKYTVLKAVKNLTSHQSGSSAGKKRRKKKNESGTGQTTVSVLPGELLAFVEILCDARVDGAVDLGVEGKRNAKYSMGIQSDDDEDDASRYDVDDDTFDPDEPL